MPPLALAGDLPRSEVQQLWFATRQRAWSTLVVVPVHPEGSCLHVAAALANVGTLYEGKQVRVLDAEGAELSRASALISEMVTHAVQGGKVIASVSSVLTNQVGIPLATAADAVLVCVEMGTAHLAAARRTLELIGTERIVGCVALRPERKR